MAEHTFLPWFFYVHRNGAVQSCACHGSGNSCCTCHGTESCGDSDVEKEEEKERAERGGDTVDVILEVVPFLHVRQGISQWQGRASKMDVEI